MVLREDIVTNEIQHDLDNLGIAKTAREEKARQRDENARMAKLYRKHVLKEPDAPELVSIQGPLQAPPKPAPVERVHVERAPEERVPEEREEVGSFGD
jgi:hypothetical protein